MLKSAEAKHKASNLEVVPRNTFQDHLSILIMESSFSGWISSDYFLRPVGVSDCFF